MFYQSLKTGGKNMKGNIEEIVPSTLDSSDSSDSACDNAPDSARARDSARGRKRGLEETSDPSTKIICESHPGPRLLEAILWQFSALDPFHKLTAVQATNIAGVAFEYVILVENSDSSEVAKCRRMYQEILRQIERYSDNEHQENSLMSPPK